MNLFLMVLFLNFSNLFLTVVTSISHVPEKVITDNRSASENDPVKEIKQWQKKLNQEYKDPKKSPLTPEDRKEFKTHDFFPINLTYRVEAELTLTEDEKFFDMKTTTARLPQYRKYGVATFYIAGKLYKLNIYQSADLLKKEGYSDYLFLPFTDHTNGSQTYGGGRYIELRIPKPGHKLVIDFNQAFNPYCAYNKKYSCPIVPLENRLETEIPAGVKLVNH